MNSDYYVDIPQSLYELIHDTTKTQEYGGNSRM